MTSETAAAILAAAGLCALLVTGHQDVRRIGVLAWAGGSLWLASDLLDSSIHRVGTLLSSHPAVGVVALAAAVVALAAAAAVVHRMPWVFAVACVVAAPVRIPIHIGGDDARLLLPLYGVLAAGALATLYDVLRGGGSPCGSALWLARSPCSWRSRPSRSSGRSTRTRAPWTCCSSTCRSAS